MTIAETLGVIAFFISAPLGIYQLALLNETLKLQITETELVSQEDNWSVFLIQLSFLNASSIGRIVFRLDIEPTEEYQVERLHYKHGLSTDSLVYVPRSAPDSVIPIYLPKSDILLTPLDISPRSSKTGWIALGVTRKDHGTLGSGNDIHLDLKACNFYGKVLAETQVTLKTQENTFGTEKVVVSKVV